MGQLQRGGGLLTGADLADYRVRERRPLRVTYLTEELQLTLEALGG
ncbi:hypothetical protein BH23ACT2_BH23ACT2_24650 [soil metagenome]